MARHYAQHHDVSAAFIISLVARGLAMAAPSEGSHELSQCRAVRQKHTLDTRMSVIHATTRPKGKCVVRHNLHAQIAQHEGADFAILCRICAPRPAPKVVGMENPTDYT